MLLIVCMSRCSCCGYRHGSYILLNSSVTLVPKVCLLCPCACCTCLVNPHVSLYHVAFITFLRVFPYISHWLVDELMNRWVGWLPPWLLHWLIEQLRNWLVERFYCLEWLIHWSIACLFDRLIDRMLDGLIVLNRVWVDVMWLYVCWVDFICWLIDWYMDRLIDRSIEWVVDRLLDRYMHWWIYALIDGLTYLSLIDALMDWRIDWLRWEQFVPRSGPLGFVWSDSSYGNGSPEAI